MVDHSFLDLLLKALFNLLPHDLVGIDTESCVLGTSTNWKNFTDPKCDCACPENSECTMRCYPQNDILVCNKTKDWRGCARSSYQFWNNEVYRELERNTNLSSASFERLTVNYNGLCRITNIDEVKIFSSDNYLPTKIGYLIGENIPHFLYYLIYSYVKKPNHSPIKAAFITLCTVEDKNESAIYWIQFTWFGSITFMILTCLVYGTMSSLQNLHGKSLLCHVLSLIVGCSIVIAIPAVGQMSISICFITGRLT